MNNIKLITINHNTYNYEYIFNIIFDDTHNQTQHPKKIYSKMSIKYR